MDNQSNLNEEENPETFLKLKQLLDEKNVPYQLMEHEAAKTSEEAARIRNTSLESGAKAILLKADKIFYLIIISAALKFSNKLTKNALKAKSLRFADMKEGCLNGAVPPFGSIFNLKTLVDESLYKQGDTISFNAGMRTKSMIMRVEDYKKFENPEVIKINEDENKMI